MSMNAFNDDKKKFTEIWIQLKKWRYLDSLSSCARYLFIQKPLFQIKTQLNV